MGTGLGARKIEISGVGTRKTDFRRVGLEDCIFQVCNEWKIKRLEIEKTYKVNAGV